jgi:A/G-specific adenine glycosylase
MAPIMRSNTNRAKAILRWYDRHRRVLPWRSAPGQRADPYAVWLSEIMLQQTTVAAVGPYFERFLVRWPRVQDLAAASLDEILTEWQGLGYYARARNLHKCAEVVATEHGGVFPDTEEDLLTLPGIGAYTAAAIAAIAFDRRAVVVDGNVERVMARLFAEETALPGAKPILRDYAAGLTPEARPGDYAQAVMDLGATVCTVRDPKCLLCPWSDDCLGRARGIAESLPRRAAKPEKPLRRGVAFWLTKESADGPLVLLRRRPETGLLGGMMEIPSTPWTLNGAADIESHAPVKAAWRAVDGAVKHTFTHFHLELKVVAAKANGQAVADGVWWPLDRLSEQALPTVMKKIVRHAHDRSS